MSTDAFTITHIRDAAQTLAAHLHPTPILHAPTLDDALGCTVYVKAECLQLTGAFKIRGALNTMLRLDDAARQRGVITFSAGNHGQAVAAAAKLTGAPATIVLPRSAPKIKVERCRWWGAQTVFYDPATEDRSAVVAELSRDRDLTLIHPFDDLRVMAGQGTVGLECVEQLRARNGERNCAPDAVIVNCSGGGLASGVLTAVRDAWPDVPFYLTEIKGLEKWRRALASRQPEAAQPLANTVLDGINGPAVGALPLQTVLAHLSTSGNVHPWAVDDDAALHAVRLAFEHLKIVLEPAGAAGLAALFADKAAFKDKRVLVIASGGNVDPGVFARALAGQA